MKIFLVLLGVLAFLATGSNASKVLFFFPSVTKSIKITFWPIVEEMSRRGHDVYVFIPFDEESKFSAKVINVDPEGELSKLIKEMSKEMLKVGEKNDPPLNQILELFMKKNEAAFEHPTMKTLLADPENKIDLVITMPFMCEPIYYAAYKWNASLVLYSTAQSMMPSLNQALGQPFNSAVAPFTLTPFKMEMTFIERVINTAAIFAFDNIFRRFLVLRESDAILDKHFPNDPPRPSLLDLERNLSLALSFGHPFLLDGFEPVVPNYVDVGMLNCQPAKGFKKGDKIGDFISKSQNGVIFVSFGSALETSLMDEGRRQMFLRIFRRFPEYDFIWKWETEAMDDKPDNLLLSKWLPQMEILAHPKTKLFISHLGLSSFQESLCHQQQVLGIPVDWDQLANGKELERLGFGQTIPYTDIEEEKLYVAIKEMLTVNVYTDNAKKYGSVLMDQINKPLDRAVWWLEHIMRHPGMYIGKSGAHRLNWIQYNLLDVYGFIVAVVITIVYSLKKLLALLCCRKTKSKRD